MKKKRKQRVKPPEERQVALVTSEINIEAAAAEQPQHVRRFSMTAYTGGAMVLAGWRYPVVVDLAGLTIGKQHRPILLDHTRDVDFVMGQTDRITVENHRLLVAGEVMGDSAKTRQVIALADRGFTWRASIGARAGQVEFVPEGKTVEVNGREFTGPVNVARSVTLGEVSFVVLGADENTSAEIAASTNQSDKEIDMEFAEWLESQGFDSDELTDAQMTSLQVLFATQGERTDAATGTAKTGSSETATGGIEDENPVATLRAELAAETSRVHAIRKTCAGEHGEIEAKAIAEGWDETRTELEVLRATRPEGPAIHSEDGHGAFADGIEAALCMSAGNISEETCGTMFSDRAMEAALSKQLRGVGLHYLMYNVIRAAGKHVKPGLVDNDFIRAAMSADRTIQAAGGFSTISLTGILSNVANKTMLASFESVDNVLGRIAAQADANDFKQVTSYRMTGIGEFKKVGPDGELKHGSLGEETFQNQVETYGTILSLNRQMMINDDLGAFLRLPRIIGRQSAIKLQKVGFGLLLANAGAFFSEGNNYYFEGADTNLQISRCKTISYRNWC